MARGVLLRNFLSLGVSRLLVRSATGLAGIVVARHLGADGYGLWASALAFATVAVVFTDLGSPQVLLRDGARKAQDLDRTLGSALVLKVVALVVVYPAMLALSRALGHPPELTAVLAVLGAGVLLQSLSQIPIALFQAAERMHLTAAVQLLLALGLLGGVSVVGAAGGGILAMAAVPGLISLLFLPVLVLRAVRPHHPRLVRGELRRLLQASLPFALGNLFFLLNAQAALMVMGGRLDPEAVGRYAAAAKLVALLYFVPNIVASVVYPVLFRTAASDPARHVEASRTVLRWVSLFGLALAGVLTLASEEVLWLIYGEGYLEAAPLLRILAWALALQCVSYPLGDALTTTDHQRTRVRVTAVVAVANLVAAAWAAGRLGVEGVAWVTVTAEAALALGYGASLRRLLPAYRPAAAWLRAALPAAVALAAGVSTRRLVPLPGPWDAMVAVAAFAVVGLAGLALAGFFQPVDRALLGSLRRRPDPTPPG